MHEYSNVKEALEELININEGLVHEQDGKSATARTIQELNSEIVYQICDLLGCDDLYMEQNKKATHDGMDDLIKKQKISVLQAELTFYKKLASEQDELIDKLLDAIEGSKEQLASHELRIESAERKITELRMDYEKLITKGS